MEEVNIGLILKEGLFYIYKILMYTVCASENKLILAICWPCGLKSRDHFKSLYAEITS